MLSYLLGLLSVALSVPFVAAEDELTVVDLSQAVQFSPSSAWHSVEDGGCGNADHYTTMVGANATVQFTGT